MAYGLSLGLCCTAPVAQQCTQTHAVQDESHLVHLLSLRVSTRPTLYGFDGTWVELTCNTSVVITNGNLHLHAVAEEISQWAKGGWELLGWKCNSLNHVMVAAIIITRISLLKLPYTKIELVAGTGNVWASKLGCSNPMGSDDDGGGGGDGGGGDGGGGGGGGDDRGGDNVTVGDPLMWALKTLEFLHGYSLTERVGCESMHTLSLEESCSGAEIITPEVQGSVRNVVSERSEGRLTGKIESTEATTDTRGLGGVVVKPQGEVEKLEVSHSGLGQSELEDGQLLKSKVKLTKRPCATAAPSGIIFNVLNLVEVEAVLLGSCGGSVSGAAPFTSPRARERPVYDTSEWASCRVARCYFKLGREAIRAIFERTAAPCPVPLLASHLIHL
ncbi:hypothetical protein BD769DRAFT_1397374 [Suillus cothurnatus]|nr:hypothetical protein BD769DRAFT_1397374 [Suillus cothurnatus]